MVPEALTKKPDVFPFKTTLSLDPLVKFWKDVPQGDEKCLVTGFAKRLLEEVDNTPDLLGPIHDPSIFEKYPELVYALMTPVFPPASWEIDCSAAIPPFQLNSFYSTHVFDRMRFFANGAVTSKINVSEDELRLGMIIRAYAAVLKVFYDIDLLFDYPVISTVQDPETGLDRYYQWRLNPRFVEVRSSTRPRELTADDRKELLEHILDPSVVTRILPAEGFEFYGFTIFNAVDVTDQEALSSLRLDLIGRDTLLSETGFIGLQQKLRILFRRPDIVLGLASLPRDVSQLMQSGHKIGDSFVLDDACTRECSHVRGSVYERALSGKDPVIIDDLEKLPHSTQLSVG